MTEKCASCGGNIAQKFMPMEKWNTKGPLCGKCYSKMISDHYPGDHVRV